MVSRRALVKLLATGALIAPLLLWSPPLKAAVSLTANPVLTDLNRVATFTFAPNGTIFYGELVTGEIHIVNPSRSSDRLFFTIGDLYTRTGNHGLLGLALHPKYPAKPYLYVYASRQIGGKPQNQILRLTNSGGKGTGQKILLRWPAAGLHAGGRIMFGPDGRLYAVSGDANQNSAPQDLNSRRGKVLRMTVKGTVPSDNPFPNKYIYAYGIRNSFGFDFDPRTGRMWATDNGPECNDELNLIKRGGNYGHGPSDTCDTPPKPPKNTNQDGPNPTLPKRFFASTFAPTGVAFCSKCGLGEGTRGRLFFGTFTPGSVHMVTLGPKRWNVLSDRVVYRDQRVAAIERGPSGALYFSNLNNIYRLSRG